MTKEELEKEAEEWLDERYLKDMGVRKPCKEAYLAGAEPREKRIAELEKENAELKEKLETTEKTRDYWKDSSFDWRHKCTSRKPFRAAVKAQRQLTKAKDLIELLLSDNRIMKAQFESEEQANIWFEHIHQAEQFISEVVK